jgi:hypothetical protein
MVHTTLTIRMITDPTFVWEKRAASEDEAGGMEYYFGMYPFGSDSSFFIHQTFSYRIAHKVHLIGLREFALLIALILDCFVWIGRKIGVLIHFPYLSDHPQKIFLKEIGAPESILRQNRIIVQYDCVFDEENRDWKSRKVLEYQINPD